MTAPFTQGAFNMVFDYLLPKKQVRFAIKPFLMPEFTSGIRRNKAAVLTVAKPQVSPTEKFQNLQSKFVELFDSGRFISRQNLSEIRATV